MVCLTLLVGGFYADLQMRKSAKGVDVPKGDTLKCKRCGGDVVLLKAVKKICFNSESKKWHLPNTPRIKILHR
jgi:hypothetical protein